MKISSDPGMVSALETWLRDTADAQALDHTSPGLTNASSGQQMQVSAGSEPRDSAEGLLELDVWEGVPDGSRLLTSSALFQPRDAEPAGVIQGWTEHIFQPLV